MRGLKDSIFNLSLRALSFFSFWKKNGSSLTKDEYLKAKYATMLSFFTAGISTAPWASVVPYVKERLMLSDMHFASIILCYGLGAIVGMPLTAIVVSKIGVKKVIAISMIMVYACMAFVANPYITVFTAYLAVLLWGFSIGILDVANNIHAAHLEKLSGKHLMSRFHGFFTIGCIFAAVFFTLLLYLTFHTLSVALLLSTLGILLLFKMYKGLINVKGEDHSALQEDAIKLCADSKDSLDINNDSKDSNKDNKYGSDSSKDGSASSKDSNTAEDFTSGLGGSADTNSFANLQVKNALTKGKSTFRVDRVLIVLGFICLIMYLTEGMVYDWSGVYLIKNSAIAIEIATVGYLSFEIATAIMRFIGDRLVEKIGALYLLVTGGIVASLALLVLSITSNAYVMVAIFFIGGLSLANVVPVMFSEAARHNKEYQGRAISFVGTMGYSGLLLGPGLLGGVATITNLRGMVLFVGLLVILMSYLAYRILKRSYDE